MKFLIYECKEIEFVIPCEVLIFCITQCAWRFNSPTIVFAICNFQNDQQDLRGVGGLKASMIESMHSSLKSQFHMTRFLNFFFVSTIISIMLLVTHRCIKIFCFQNTNKLFDFSTNLVNVIQKIFKIFNNFLVGIFSKISTIHLKINLCQT